MMGKNILIFSDGTGAEGGEGPDSNVYKLFKAVENRSSDQIAFYDSGLGTGNNLFVSKLISKASGAGITRNILECYGFLFENYQAGDKIYLFGFSRGAATVRSLSSFIHLFGILPKSRPELIKKAYKIYKIRDKDKRIDRADEFSKKHNPMWSMIEFIGVWDTVAALGVPFGKLDKLVNMLPAFKHKYHDFNLHEGVKNAFHALSVDDVRLTFHPVLWDETLQPGQSMEQVWFAGVHTDIGGGYEETGLSDIALHWMVGKAEAAGLRLFSRDILNFKGNPDGVMHDSSGVFRQKVRFWPKVDSDDKPRGKPVLHASVRKRSENGSGYDPWILN